MDRGKYKESLKSKLESAARINGNFRMQKEAIEAGDIKLLGKLVKRQQGNIDRLKKISEGTPVNRNVESDAELEQLKAGFNTLIYDAVRENIANISKAEKLKETIGNSICSLKINGNAIKNGYFKKVPQQYGYFIDKKVGK